MACLSHWAACDEHVVSCCGLLRKVAFLRAQWDPDVTHAAAPLVLPSSMTCVSLQKSGSKPSILSIQQSAVRALPRVPDSCCLMYPVQDDDVISMGATFARMCQQGHEVGNAGTPPSSLCICMSSHATYCCLDTLCFGAASRTWLCALLLHH